MKCPQCGFKHDTRHDRYMKRRIARGQCIHCPSPATAGRQRCQRCHEKTLLRAKARRAALRDEDARLLEEARTGR